ncbi:MAG TPA: glucose-1-phosphate thymidylyltransferase [Candidatus Bathyarchaeota archaeon]|nr:glucose-1-phosphate thymidylyltransferase [Candidatus Bathyarchaeota archaeon]
MIGVILAAGEGRRLRPLTFTRPKHMIPVGGKPILEHLVNAVRAAGIKEILVVVGYKAETIKEYFGNGSEFGVSINYVDQKRILGTADAIASVKEHVNEDFLVVNGDLLSSSDAIKSVIKMHEKVESIATLAAVKVEKPEQYGILKVKDGRLTDIIEKPSSKTPSSNLVNAGIYLFSIEIFDFIEQTKISKRGELEITDSIHLIVKNGKTVAVTEIPSDSWLDIGRPWDLLDANMRVLKSIKPSILGRVEKGAHIKGPVFVGRNTIVRSGAYIEGPVFIGDGSDIGPNCYIRPYTSIGRNVRIGNACEIKNSILMDGVRIGHLSYVGDSIIGEGCNLGAGSISANLRFDKKTVKMKIRGEKIDTGRIKMGVIMGDNVMTGIGALFMPGVTIGHNSWIGPNIVVYNDVPPNTILTLEQQIRRRNFQ